MNKNCNGCGQDIEEVKEYHEVEGHNVNHEIRNELMFDDLCEDCVDDILMDMMKGV